MIDLQKPLIISVMVSCDLLARSCASNVDISDFGMFNLLSLTDYAESVVFMALWQELCHPTKDKHTVILGSYFSSGQRSLGTCLTVGL